MSVNTAWLYNGLYARAPALLVNASGGCVVKIVRTESIYERTGLACLKPVKYINKGSNETK